MDIMRRVRDLIIKLISYKTILILLATYIYINTTYKDWKTFMIYILFLIYSISVREFMKIIHILSNRSVKYE